MLGIETIKTFITATLIKKYAGKLVEKALTALSGYLLISDNILCTATTLCEDLGGVLSANAVEITAKVVAALVIIVNLGLSMKKAPAEVIGKQVMKDASKADIKQALK